MHGEVREVEKERPVLVRLDELLGATGDIVVEVIVVEARFHSRDVVRRKIGWRRALLRATDVDIEALLLRQVTFAAHVPFADGGGGISNALERFGDGHLRERKLLLEG